MTNITVIDHSGDPRMETGPVQFGEDWPGVFIRGDSALGYNLALSMVLTALAKGETPDVMSVMMLKGLSDTLAGCRA